jgi:Zn-dependent M28 family amino/carboxypeptidase
MDLATWFEMGARRDFRPIDLPVTIDVDAEVDIERATTRNVLGLIEGSDPRSRDEIVVVTAHYDHLGQKADADAEDTIYNGAWDNAAGTSALLGIAHGVGKAKPRRSVLIFGVAAHEVGLLGSRWFAEHPPLDLSRFVANINVDMPQIFGTTRDIVAIGKEMSDLGDILARVAARFPVDGDGALRVEGDPTPGAGRYYRSDQLHFARKGIPAIYVGPGDDYVVPPAVDPVEYRADHYHQVSDELREVWDFDALTRDARVVLATVLELADRDERPSWAPGSEFASARSAQRPERSASAASTRATTASTESEASTTSASSGDGSSRSRS